MCLDVTNFAILPLNSVPGKKTHLFASENFSVEMREKPKYRTHQHKVNHLTNPSAILYSTQTGHYFSWKSFKITLCLHQVLIPARKVSHSIIPVLPPCWMPVGNEWCISPAGPPRHFSIPRIHSRPFTGENPTSPFRASRLLTYPGYGKFAPETILVIPKTSRITWTNHPFFRGFCC